MSDWLSRALGGLAIAFAVACSAKHDEAPLPPPRGAAPLVDVGSIERAEDLRRAKDIPEPARTSHDVAVRRLAARSLARIADADSLEGLLHALDDEDGVTVAWGAYGLGASCKGHEESNVRALAARAASFEREPDAMEQRRDAVDPRVAIARAIGRCGGAMSEGVLASWVRAARPGLAAAGAHGKGGDALASAAAYALGDVAGRRSALGDETMSALLDAAASSPASGAQGLESALYPFGRTRAHSGVLRATRREGGDGYTWRGAGGGARVRDPGARANRSSARSMRSRRSSSTIRSYLPSAPTQRARCDSSTTTDTPPPRMRSRQMGPGKDTFDALRVAGDDYGILSSLVASLGPEVPKKSEPALFALAGLTAPGAPASLARRIAELRCGAAAALSKGAYDSDVLKHCDAESSESYQRARLASLLRRPLVARPARGVACAHEERSREGPGGRARGDRAAPGARGRSARRARGGALVEEGGDRRDGRRRSSTHTPIECSSSARKRSAPRSIRPPPRRRRARRARSTRRSPRRWPPRSRTSGPRTWWRREPRSSTRPSRCRSTGRAPRPPWLATTATRRSGSAPRKRFAGSATA